jgi:site-specific recombinase XerD
VPSEEAVEADRRRPALHHVSHGPDRRARGALVHALRHTFATRLAEDGATATEIMNLLGHASLATSRAYINATAREHRQTARANRTYQALAQLADGAPPVDCR